MTEPIHAYEQPDFHKPYSQLKGESWLRARLADPSEAWDPCVVMLREDAEEILGLLDATRALIQTGSNNATVTVDSEV